MANPIIEAVVVPRDLYYHEIAYVRRLEALITHAEKLIRSLQESDGGPDPTINELGFEYNRLLKEHQEKSK